MAKEKQTVTAIDKLIQKAMANDEDIGNPDDGSLGTWPMVLSWLCKVDCGKGMVKEPAKLSIKAVPGGYVGTLSDNTLKVAIDAFAQDLAGVFDALESALSQAVPNIRTFGRGEPMLKKRRNRDGR